MHPLPPVGLIDDAKALSSWLGLTGGPRRLRCQVRAPTRHSRVKALYLVICFDAIPTETPNIALTTSTYIVTSMRRKVCLVLQFAVDSTSSASYAPSASRPANTADNHVANRAPLQIDRRMQG